MDPNVVWCMLAIFSTDSPFSKWLFFYELYFDGVDSPLEVHDGLCLFVLTQLERIDELFQCGDTWAALSV